MFVSFLKPDGPAFAVNAPGAVNQGTEFSEYTAASRKGGSHLKLAFEKQYGAGTPGGRGAHCRPGRGGRRRGQVEREGGNPGRAAALQREAQPLPGAGRAGLDHGNPAGMIGFEGGLLW